MSTLPKTKTICNLSITRAGEIHRRGFLQRVGLGAAGLSMLGFNDLMAVKADELRRRNMACIVLWMQGAPSQFETFDPKPDHENGGGTEVIETAVPGVRIAQGWNETAKVLDRIALIRSMTNREGSHQRATYQLHTGYLPNGSVKHPSFGSVVASELGDPEFDLPSIVSIGETGRPTAGLNAGILGVEYEPFQVPQAGQMPANLQIPRPVGRDRFQRRLGLLGQLESRGFGRSGGIDQVEMHQTTYRQTADLVLSPRVDAFELEGEPSELRDAYGRNPFGQGCLLARRLVERGVTFVEVRTGNWDTHFDNFNRTAELVARTDPAFATLITDLESRGMLDNTMILWMGEFGRTPRINPRAGRDHYPRVFNAALAGGGVRGGQVIGSSTPDGTAVAERPVAVNDLLRSVCHGLKIDADKENYSGLGRPIKVVDGGQVVNELFG